MGVVRLAKRISTLPGTLTPDTLYLVRVGAGFELYCSDMTGEIAHRLNGIRVANCWPALQTTPRIVGDVAGTALTTLALTASRLYFMPLLVPRRTGIVGLRFSVTTAAIGTAAIGIYSNDDSMFYDMPGQLLASVTGLSTGTTGNKTGTISYTFATDTLYWIGFIASAAAIVRALAVGSTQTALGRTENDTTAIAYRYAAGSGSTLPAQAPTNLTNGIGACPAIYLVE